jgi:hypothetical protein
LGYTDGLDGWVIWVGYRDGDASQLGVPLRNPFICLDNEKQELDYTKPARATLTLGEWPPRILITPRPCSPVIPTQTGRNDESETSPSMGKGC